MVMCIASLVSMTIRLHFPLSGYAIALPAKLHPMTTTVFSFRASVLAEDPMIPKQENKITGVDKGGGGHKGGHGPQIGELKKG